MTKESEIAEIGVEEGVDLGRGVEGFFTSQFGVIGRGGGTFPLSNVV